MNINPLLSPSVHDGSAVADGADLSAPTWRASDASLESRLAQADALRRTDTSPIVRAASQADELAHRGLERVRLVGTQLREQASRTGEVTVGYVKDQPVKSVLIAAAAGAALAVLAGLLVRPRH